jgi:serine/threonine-protein kinase
MNPISMLAMRITAFAISLLAVVQTAHAQPSSADKAAAEALFEQGKALMKEGDVAKGCDKLDASQRLDPAVGTLLFLGDCYEKLGKKASAWVTFREASSLAQRQGDGRQNIADVRATALHPQVSYVKVNVTNPVDGLVVRRAGVDVPRGSWGSTLPTDAGRYTFEASAPGKQTWSHTLDVKDGGQTFSLDVPALADAGGAGPAEPKPLPQPTKTQKPDKPISPLLIAGAVTGGVGVVALIIGGVFGLLANDSNQQSLDHCPTDPGLCDAEGVGLRERAKDRATVSTALFAVGGALAAGGVVLIVLGATQDDREEVARWQLASQLGPGQAALVVRGRF